MWWPIWGKKTPKTTPKEAILRMRENLRILEKREAHLDERISKELETAKSNATKNKAAAMAALKRKKLLEDQLEKINSTRMTLETQMMAIESANVNLETLNAMRQGTDAMKTIHKDMSIEKVDQTMDEIRDQMDLANEVSAAISQPELLGLGANDSELLEELELLEQEQLDKQLLNAERPPVSAVKNPTKPVFVQEEEEEDAELAELRESMGLTN
ncbi:hypothetical protein BB559_002864 [Furculomyces boomerangus]|uniref:Vacuolar-sorting protein SNF7 n=2 Tax=Harpellales TaxID=61421 RepID=A0A2T9YRJ8_9FUNG|nr:hypothetical protein BB559_004595 [Furculomyces boomerangus]PVU94978.1 hypothetical protein BB559_002864 [Furculomyces boomerangus]PVZ98490.1 hypothetical protein BB558_005516 [Smittium angustum]